MIVDQTLAESQADSARALKAGDLAAIVSVRGRLSRLRRAAGADWTGLARAHQLDEELRSAVTDQQLALGASSRFRSPSAWPTLRLMRLPAWPHLPRP